MMHSAVRFYLAAGIVTFLGVGFIASDFSITVAHAQKRYRENPQLRKSRAREALVKAMTLNAQVEMMLHQNSDQVSQMMQLLSQSYGHQVTAIAQMEGLVREASFKDPIMDRGILEMYEQGKPPTMRAQSDIKRGDYAAALQSLAVAKRTHRKFMQLLY
jgi:hypothetical protein